MLYDIIYCVAEIILALAFGSPFSWFPCPIIVTPSLWVFFFEYFFAFLDFKMLQTHIISALVQESAISPRGPLPPFFLPRPFFPSFPFWALKTMIWVLCMLIAKGVTLLLGPLCWQSQKICVYTNLCIYPFMKIPSCIELFCVKNEFMLISPSLIHYHTYPFLAFPPLFSFISYSNNENLAIHLSSNVTSANHLLNCSISVYMHSGFRIISPCSVGNNFPN